MKTLLRYSCQVCVTAGLTLVFGIAAQESIDWDRARQLHRRAQQGENLSAADEAYLERAKRERAKQGAPRGRGDAERAQPAFDKKLTPLSDLGTGWYRDQDGGLYGGGKNEPPPAHLNAALDEARKIKPLDEDGEPADSGKVVLLSIGMSNTTQEFSQFKRMADADPAKSESLVIVDGAQGGQDAVRIANADAPFWTNIEWRLKEAGVSAEQVQVIWLKQAIAGPSRGWPEEAERLQEMIGKNIQIAKRKYPNLRLAYLSSRIYAGYATTRLNPEPYAYESAFAVRSLIREQIEGKAGLNPDPRRGDVRAPLLLWGPYFWADGTNARASDGLSWTREDLAADGTHPSPAGRKKVAEQLLKFFKNDQTAREWFLK